MPQMKIMDRLNDGEHLLLDGGTGSELQRRGVNVLQGATAESGLLAWSALANIEAADVVQQVHQDYLRVGADIIISNNFWTSPTRLERIGLGAKWKDYARAAAENAVKARDNQNAEAYIAGGIAPPCLQRQSQGRDDPDVIVMGEKAFRREISEHARLLAASGADLVLVEYVGRIADCVAAVDAGAEAGLPVFLGVRHMREDGSMQYGEQLEELGRELNDHPVDAILLMCSKPESVSAALPRLKTAFEGPVGAYPNIDYHATAPLEAKKAGDLEAVDREADFLRGADYFPARLAAFASKWKGMGAQILGGCCATGPEHIQAMRPVVKTVA